MLYRERLTVSVAFWLAGLLMVASIWLVTQHAYGAAGSVPATLAATAVIGGLLLWWGWLQISVRTDGLQVGRATLPVWAIGQVEAFEGAAAGWARGRDVTRGSHLVLRGYLDGVVRIEVADPGDPTPYWVVSSRRPAELAAAIGRAQGQAAQSRQM